jgi:hypothetical protein
MNLFDDTPLLADEQAMFQRRLVVFTKSDIDTVLATIEEFKKTSTLVSTGIAKGNHSSIHCVPKKRRRGPTHAAFNRSHDSHGKAGEILHHTHRNYNAYERQLKNILPHFEALDRKPVLAGSWANQVGAELSKRSAQSDSILAS